MRVIIFESVAAAISLMAFVLGIVLSAKKDSTTFMKTILWASGCYFLEELWVIVNFLFGTGKEFGLLTVRLFGFFGCFAFLFAGYRLEPYARLFRKSFEWGIVSGLLFIGFAVFAVCTYPVVSVFAAICGGLSLLPAILVAGLSFTCLLKGKSAGDSTLRTVIHAVIFVLSVAGVLYVLPYYYGSALLMDFYDVALSLLILATIILAGREAMNGER